MPGPSDKLDEPFEEELDAVASEFVDGCLDTGVYNEFEALIEL